MKVSALILVLAACGGGKPDEPVAAGKLAKLDVRVSVDAKGRIRPMFQLVDQKLKPVAVTGTYSIAIARADGTELCKLDGTFAPGDFTEHHAYRAAYRDASCPADPGADQLKVAVKVESPDKTIERTLDVQARLVYESLKPSMPVGSGSAGSGSGGLAEAPAGSGSGSAGSGSAQ